MAEAEGQTSNEGAPAPESQSDGDKGGDAVTRPEYVPENFWDAEKGEVKVEDLAKAHTDLGARFSKGKDGLRSEIEADITKELTEKLRPEIEGTVKAEIFKERPAKVDDYAVGLPEEGNLVERAEKTGIVLLSEKPGDDFQPEEGKSYFVFDETHPLLGWWKNTAFDNGLSQEQFMDGVLAYAEAELAMTPGPEALEAARAETYKALGENGKDRFDFARSRLEGLIGADNAKLIWPDNANPSPQGVEAIEAILTAAGEPKFSPELHAIQGKDNQELLAEAKELQASDDYWQNNDKQARVQEIFRRVYPSAA
jgi:hypothetical protein